MAQHPLVDVLMSAYNAAPTLRSAVESILGQTVANIRLIVIDDGSTDETPEILKEVAERDTRLYILTQQNGGLVNALNAGLEICSARFLARLDADDLAYPDRFAKQIAYLEANPDCVAIGCDARHIDAAGEFTGYVAQLPDPSRADPRWVPSREPYMVHSSLMTYTVAVKNVEGYRHVGYAEDTDLFWRLQQSGRLSILPETLIDYRVHADSITSASLQNGRLSATFSQLAGISAMRRRSGKPDLSFNQDDLARYRQAGTLPRIYELARQGLAPEEAQYLEVALAAKILELVSYRPFDLHVDDCRFIREAISSHIGQLNLENRSELKRSWTGTAAQLYLKRKQPEAFELVSRRFYPEVGGRIICHKILSQQIKVAIRSRLGRTGNYNKADAAKAARGREHQEWPSSRARL